MNAKPIVVRLKQDSYPIYIAPGAVSGIAPFVKRSGLGNYAVIVTSARIYELHKKTIASALRGIAHSRILVDDGEKAKSLSGLLKILSGLLRADGVSKSLFLVSVGGGTVGDVAGFAASIYKRGIPYIQIPTTLLSQIDASIGGKTAIDLPQAKNILGTFYQPKAVFIDPVFLSTLRLAQVREGVAEAIKYGAIADKALFDYLKAHHAGIMALRHPQLMYLIRSCVAIKARVVSRDERERKGLRTILNFGHTLAHAIEATGAYKAFSHGEAVAVGMCYAAALSRALGACSQAAVDELCGIVKLFGLPTTLDAPSRGIINALRYDKKFTGSGIRMVLLNRPGKVEVRSAIPASIVLKTLRHFVAAGRS